MNQNYPVPDSMVERALAQYQTPFHVYDLGTLRQNSDRLYDSMHKASVNGFQNYFAVKALPNPHVLRELVAMGHGLDCSSLAELTLAEQLGVSGDQIMFTSNNTSLAEFQKAHELGAIINFDDESYIETYLDRVGIPAFACCRYNPGNAFVNSNEAGNMLRGNPSDQKYGMDKEMLLRSYRKLQEAGTPKFGLHTMLLSNNSSWQNHAQVASILCQLAVDIAQQVEVVFSFINLGGGIGVAYEPGSEQFDYSAFAEAVANAYQDTNLSALGSPRIIMENGRAISATAGWLVTNVQNIKQSYKTYVGVDASMADLMRPGMYGSYHHITLLGDDNSRSQKPVDVVGPLCENNDKFAIDRQLPELHIDDTLIIHTTGAHGHAMGFNYNGRLRSAELLNSESGEVRMIRRAETLDDLFATIVPLEDAS